MSDPSGQPLAPAAPLLYADAVARLERSLTAPLPGVTAHLSMAPEYRDRAAHLAVEGKDCREAAVLVLIVPSGEEAVAILTLRHSHLPHHPGQISFPGGRREPGEALQEAALREAWEEVGLDVPVRLLGVLSPLFIPPSRFCVYPFVATLGEPPRLRPHEAEVEAILHVPLARLLDPASRRRERRDVRGTLAWVPFFDVDGLQIWGATAMILSELLAMLEEPRN